VKTHFGPKKTHPRQRFIIVIAYVIPFVIIGCYGTLRVFVEVKHTRGGVIQTTDGTGVILATTNCRLGWGNAAESSRRRDWLLVHQIRGRRSMAVDRKSVRYLGKKQRDGQTS
jgi:hypothetical protein